MMTITAVLTVWLGGMQAAIGAQVIVTVAGVRSDRGSVNVAICPREEFLQSVCRYVGRAPARVGSVVVTINDVSPGIYAAQAYHDANGNDVLDRNWFGMPLEGMGFSKDAPFHFGPPAFVEAAFHVTGDTTAVLFRLRYF